MLDAILLEKSVPRNHLFWNVPARRCALWGNHHPRLGAIITPARVALFVFLGQHVECFAVCITPQKAVKFAS